MESEATPEIQGVGTASAPRAARRQAAGRSSSRVHPLVWILLAGTVLRTALWVCLGDTPLSVWDEREYNAIARNLATRGEFALHAGKPTSIRPPLYPLAVAGIYRVAGMENFRAVRLAQVAVSVLGIGLVYRLGVLLYGRRVGAWAAGLSAVYPSLLVYNNLLLTETLFTTLLLGACLALSGAMRRGSIGLAALGGAVLGLAALTRSVLWISPVILVPFLLAATRGRPARRALAAGCFAAAFAATVAPWAVRNTRLHGTFTTIDVMGGRNLMMGNYEYTPLNRAWNAIQIGGSQSWDRVLASSHPEYDRLTQGQKDKLALREAVRFARAHPALTLRRDAVKFFNFWGLERELIAGAAHGDYGPIRPPALLALTGLIFGSYAAAILLGIFGAVAAPPADWRTHALLLLLIAFICGMHTLSFGHSRYHLPLMPFVLIYAARALARSRAIWGRRRSRAFALACGLAAVAVAGWAVEIAVVDAQRFLAAIRSLA